MRPSRLVAASLLALTACLDAFDPKPADPHTWAIAYLDDAITLMQQNAYYRRRVKWDSVRAAAHVQAASAMTTAETYTAIRNALVALGDNHSFLRAPAAGAIRADLIIGTASALAGHPVDSLDGELLDGRFGFIHVPTFGGTGSALADTLQALIKSVDASNPCGWIVDLRHNLGGNMWPMLAGIGPILGNDDHVGSFIDADSVKTRWYYLFGGSGMTAASGARVELARTTLPAYVLRQPNPPVAVLTDSMTASSGEAIVVAFRALPRARSFGGATWGVPTANAGYGLRDGATLVLTLALDVDRAGNWYSTRIPADEPMFLSTYPATDDAVVAAAKTWLATQPGCASP